MKAKHSVSMIAEGIETKSDGNGGTDYFKGGERVSTYREEINDIIGEGLEQIDTIFTVLTEMDKDPDGLQVQKLAYVGKELVEVLNFKTEMHVDLVRKYYGEIEIERACHRQSRIEGGLPLGVVFTPRAGGDGC